MSTLPNPSSSRAIDRPPRSRRGIPLSLRIFLALLVPAGVASLLQISVPIYRQRMAIRTIERLGGQVHYEPGGPKWLRAILGDQRMKPFDKVTWVDLTTSRATDVTLAQLKALPDLRCLDVGRAQMTTAGVKQLKQLVELTELRSVSLPHDVLLTNWAAGELMRASSKMSIETRYGRDHGMRLLTRTPGMGRGIVILGPDDLKPADEEK